MDTTRKQRWGRVQVMSPGFWESARQPGRWEGGLGGHSTGESLEASIVLPVSSYFSVLITGTAVALQESPLLIWNKVLAVDKLLSVSSTGE